jgi:hypothetical protein
MMDDLSALVRHPEKLRSAFLGRFHAHIALVDNDTVKML